jgi:hypothetical protein
VKIVHLAAVRNLLYPDHLALLSQLFDDRLTSQEGNQDVLSGPFDGSGVRCYDAGLGLPWVLGMPWLSRLQWVLWRQRVLVRVQWLLRLLGWLLWVLWLLRWRLLGLLRLLGMLGMLRRGVLRASRLTGDGAVV